MRLAGRDGSVIAALLIVIAMAMPCSSEEEMCCIERGIVML
jgi:hypothetical protein